MDFESLKSHHDHLWKVCVAKIGTPARVIGNGVTGIIEDVSIRDDVIVFHVRGDDGPWTTTFICDKLEQV